MKTYANPVYAWKRAPEQDGPAHRRPVIVVGAGPVGLAAAIDLAQRGIPVVVLDEDDTVSVGSRAICYAKRALEILDRLGCGERIVQKGVEWKVGRVFFGHEQVYAFDLLPGSGHRRPAFVNLQQYHLEECLVDRLAELPAAEVRWRHKVVGVMPRDGHVLLRVATPDGDYELSCEWLIACDGARSPVRRMLGLEAEGQMFHDRFLIADIHMKSDFPAERWFWFDPPFHPGQSALLHRQADDVWRIDFQLGWDADPDLERTSERILPRLHAMLGADAEFDIEWASVYTFQCRRMQRFRHGRVLFAGDAAHVVSPFGARGANSGFQDADNLAWKLELVLAGRAPERLLDTYDAERIAGSRREHPPFDPRHRFHHAEERGVADVSRRGAFPRQAPRLRTAPRQQRPLVAAARVSAIAAQHTGPGGRDVRRHDGAGGTGRRCPGRRRRRTVASRSSARRLYAARVRGRRPASGRGARARSDSLPRRSGRRRCRQPEKRAARSRGAYCTNATTGGPGRATFCGPTSTSARAGVPSMPARCAPRSAARPATTEG